MKSLAKMYYAGAKLLERNDWIKGTYMHSPFHKSGRIAYCALGAAAHASGVLRLGTEPEIIRMEQFAEAEMGVPLSEFNDLHCEKKDEAVSILNFLGDLST